MSDDVQALLAALDDHLWDGVSGDSGWDVGANTGQNTERMLGLFSRVAAFEPAKESFRELDDRWAEDPRVLVSPLAVSDHVGTLSLDIRSAPILSGQLTATGMPYHGEHAGEPGMANWGPVVGRRVLECSTLDALATELGEPDFVKIDTEGHEVQVLKGAGELLTGRRPDLLVEFHTEQLRDECLLILIAEAGYSVEIVEPPHLPEGTHMRTNYGWLKCRAS